MIITWEQTAGLGVAYEFENGDGEAHPIGTADWPIIKRLDRAGRLSFVRNELQSRYFDAARGKANR
jgi:hypothetical protein